MTDKPSIISKNPFGLNIALPTKTIEEVKKMDPLSLDKLPLQYYNIVEKIKNKRAQNITVEEFNKFPVTVYYICGESGIGKTRMAQYLLKSWSHTFNNIKYENISIRRFLL